MTVSLFSRDAAARRRFRSPAAEAARARGRAQAMRDVQAIAAGAEVPSAELPALWSPDDPAVLIWREYHARMRMLATLMFDWGLPGRQEPTEQADFLERAIADVEGAAL